LREITLVKITAFLNLKRIVAEVRLLPLLNGGALYLSYQFSGVKNSFLFFRQLIGIRHKLAYALINIQ
jgi:hypothetical protein